MFNWRGFFGALIGFFIAILLVFLLGAGLYLICELNNAWGLALVVGIPVIGVSIAIGFEL